MLRRLPYIFIALLLAARLSYAHTAVPGVRSYAPDLAPGIQNLFTTPVFNNDTTKVKHTPQNRMDVLDRGVIKEVPKTKRQPKPEIIAPADTSNKNKPRSKRRPEGVERPPDIIRRNNN
ncbi:hypothetical protein KXQ82_13005 [Mucilaginibacter sp. HMF5004]|uniref:hypothetical protein n=1 Tax=Mucilaginibacter rivuli TaxID=2857527 RepID=UPI001C601E73|nr:hypothetical protein [Mucilaginibacter rivuli]MBW4890647.1 hypothetical protein [Mucilaginibacter rivuli]